MTRGIEKESRSKAIRELDADEDMVEGVRFTPVHEVSIFFETINVSFHDPNPIQYQDVDITLCYRSSSSTTPSYTCVIEKKLTAILTR